MTTEKSNKQKQQKIPGSVAIKNNVTILYKDSRGKYRSINRHNNTGYGILTLVSYAARGEFDGNLVPCYLGATYKKTDAGGIDHEYSAFNQYLHFDKAPRVFRSDKATESDSRLSDTVEYSFIIPAGTIISSAPIQTLKLYNNYITNTPIGGIDNPADMDELALCAELDLSDHNLNNSEVSNLKVYWRISFADISQATE